MEYELLVQAFVAVWNERDDARRAAAVRSLWSVDGRHVMGTQDVRGHEALEARVAASHRKNVVEQGYDFRPATRIAALAGVVKFHWDMCRRDSGDEVSAGVGFLLLADDGRIDCDHLFTER